MQDVDPSKKRKADEARLHNVDGSASNVKATNRDFIEYEQVAKKQKYHFAEQEGGGDEQFDEDFKIKTVDMSKLLKGNEKQRAEFAEELGTALHEIGFAVLENHGIPLKLFEDAEQAVPAVFKRDESEKLKFGPHRVGAVNSGFFAKKKTSNLHPDLVEGCASSRHRPFVSAQQQSLGAVGCSAAARWTSRSAMARK